MRTADIATALLLPPLNPSRIDIDPEHVDSIGRSIKRHGQRTPIEVHPEGERYRIDAGHCRYLAAMQHEIPTLRAQIREDSDTASTTVIQTIENLHRSDLTPMEEAIQIQRLAAELDNDPKRLALELKRTPAWIEHRLALLELAPELKEHVHNRRLAMTSALHLNRITIDEHREYHTHHAVTAGAAEPVVRAWVDQYLASQLQDPSAPPVMPPTYEPGQPVIVLMPCFLCATPHPYQQLRIQRVCNDCTSQVENAARAPNHAPPAAPPAQG